MNARALVGRTESRQIWNVCCGRTTRVAFGKDCVPEEEIGAFRASTRLREPHILSRRYVTVQCSQPSITVRTHGNRSEAI